MAPKNKGKKGKKQDDDDFWQVSDISIGFDTLAYARSRENAGTSVAGNNLATNAEDAEDDYVPPKKAGFSAFAALGIEEPAEEEEEEDFGGLMVRSWRGSRASDLLRCIASLQ